MTAVATAPPRHAFRPQPGPWSVRALVARYGPKLHGLARRICSNPSDADDLVQETFLQAHRKIEKFEGRSDPGTWLFTIAVRLCRRKFGRDPRRRAASLEDVHPFRDRAVLDLPDSSLSLLARQIDRETLEAVQARIAGLPGAFRVPLVLKDVLDLPVTDVAAVLGIKPGTVKTRVHRARLMVRRVLMERLPKRAATAPTYDKQVCLDLLAAKMDAMDHGRGFPIGQEVLCERCRAVFRELDLTQVACAEAAGGSLPEPLRRAILAQLGPEAERNGTGSGNRPRPRRLKKGSGATRSRSST